MAGEFPKFTAARAEEGRPTPHVLVKFSGADGSTAVRRRAEQDARISEDFRQRCGANARKIEDWRALV